MTLREKRERLTHSEKADTVTMMETEHDSIAVMQKYGVKRRTVTKLRAEKYKIMDQASNGDSSLQWKSQMAVKIPIIERKVMRFVEIARAAKAPITQDVIQQKALQVRDKFLKCDLHRSEILSWKILWLQLGGSRSS